MNFSEFKQLEEQRTDGPWSFVPWRKDWTVEDAKWVAACSVMVPKLIEAAEASAEVWAWFYQSVWIDTEDPEERAQMERWASAIHSLGKMKDG